MIGVVPAPAEALAPVRGRMLAAASAEAGRIVAQARIEAAALVTDAHRRAAETVARAEAQGRADSAAAAAGARSRGHEQATAIVLGARHEALEELRGEALAAITGLRSDPGYARLLLRLTAMAARAAGPDATVTVQPAGGVLARSTGVLVDVTLPRLAGLAVDALGDQVRELWTP